jgi:hypothetical protein
MAQPFWANFKRLGVVPNHEVGLEPRREHAFAIAEPSQLRRTFDVPANHLRERELSFRDERPQHREAELQ